MTSDRCYAVTMYANRQEVDLYWKEFVAKNGMEAYRHGHGLLRGCSRQFDHIRLIVNERSQGIDFGVIGAERPAAALLWADKSFLDWCRLPPQVDAAEKAYVTANRLGLVQLEWDKLRMLPHRAKPSPIIIEPGVALSRFYRLGGVHNATDLCDPAILEALPVNVLIENHTGRFGAYFPAILDPALPLLQVAQIVGLRI